MNTFDVTVVGGGMVGATLANLLARAGFAVALVDAAGRPAWNDADPVGLRVSALSPGSAAVLTQAGAWDRVRAARHCPYRRMHVEDGQGEGLLEFEAAPFGLDLLGTLVENDLLCAALWDALGDPGPQGTRPEVFAPARVAEVAQDAAGTHCTLEDGQVITAGLLVGCDGPGSRVRRAAGIGGSAWSYNQHGLVAVVRKSRPNPGVAWQRFLPGGPLAFLPLSDGASSIVWTLPTREAQALVAADEHDFMEQLGAASDGWLGRVDSVGPRAAFPLGMHLGERYVAGRVILLGDAAHGVHPLAGQGVNLGLADVAALVETLVAQRSSGGDLADPKALARFDRWRRSETAMIAGGVHAIGALFRPGALALPRSLGMRLVNGSWTLREAFLRRAAGLGPNAPRLARGVTIPELAGAPA